MNKSILVDKDYDLICVGGGIMSATLAVLTKLVAPNLKILVLERLDTVAQESSAAWNNAGTGHSALCELNYTPQLEDGSIETKKAFKVFDQFELSKSFWSYLIANELLANPENFISPVPHYSWVEGKENVSFLKNRFETLRENYRFSKMEFTGDVQKMKEWFPLMMQDRLDTEKNGCYKNENGY